MSAAVEQAGRRAVAAVIRRLADRLRADMPGVEIETREGEVVVTGHGLPDEATLRWPAGLLR